MNDRAEHGTHQDGPATEAMQTMREANDQTQLAVKKEIDQAANAADTQSAGSERPPLEKISFGMLLTQRPDIDSSKTPMEAWLRHFLLMMGVYLPFDVLISFLGGTVQTIIFWWFVFGLHISVQVLQFRTKTHVPLAVNTYPKALKFFVMTLAWPVLFL